MKRPILYNFINPYSFFIFIPFVNFTKFFKALISWTTYPLYSSFSPLFSKRSELPVMRTSFCLVIFANFLLIFNQNRRPNYHWHTQLNRWGFPSDRDRAGGGGRNIIYFILGGMVGLKVPNKINSQLVISGRGGKPPPQDQRALPLGSRRSPTPDMLFAVIFSIHSLWCIYTIYRV